MRRRDSNINFLEIVNASIRVRYCYLVMTLQGLYCFDRNTENLLFRVSVEDIDHVIKTEKNPDLGAFVFKRSMKLTEEGDEHKYFFYETKATKNNMIYIQKKYSKNQDFWFHI